jgi:integrase/recombinase XerD
MSLIGVQAGVASRAEAQRCYGAAASGSVIALWLGHESIETTQTYLHAHLALKALAKLEPYERGQRTRFRPSNRLLAFLEAL